MHADEATSPEPSPSLEELMAEEGEHLKQLTNEQLRALALKQARQLETLRREYAREAAAKEQEIKRIAAQQIAQVRLTRRNNAETFLIYLFIYLLMHVGIVEISVFGNPVVYF